MKKIIFILILFLNVRGLTHANTSVNNDTLIIETAIIIENKASISIDNEQLKEVKFKRGKAIILTILTGFLGGHRIYLGTHQRTPIIYAVTFGGFGILPLIDLIHLIVVKDISIYENKTQIMMWRKE